MLPTERTLKLLRDNGYVAGIVERQLPKCFVKVDLFGFADIVAVPTGVEAFHAVPGILPMAMPTVYVQTTDHTSHSKRRAKILQNEFAKTIVQMGNGIWVISWKQEAKPRGRWRPRVEEITAKMFSEAE